MIPATTRSVPEKRPSRRAYAVVAAGVDAGVPAGTVVGSFKDAGSRDVYLDHDAHQAVVVEVLKILQGGVKGALAFDFEA